MNADPAEGDWLRGLAPVQAAALSERVYRQLLEAIVSGRIAPGAHLVEQALADQMGVSRISLREAVRRLAGDGLVEIRPNRGAFTRRFDAEEIEEIFQLRAALEGIASERAARSIDEAGLARLEAIVAEMARLELSDDRLTGAEMDTRFHATLMALSGQRRASQMWHQMSAQITVVVYSVSAYYPQYAGFADRHRQITKLLRLRDGAAVAACLKAHITQGGQNLVEAMRKGETP